MPVEIELKLSVSPEQAARLGRLPIVKSMAEGRAATRHLVGIYYDTPDFDLRKHAVALRLRRDGARWIQTLKTEGRVEAGLHQRQELETPVPAQILHFPALTASSAGALFSDARLRQRLQPVFTTDFMRTTRIVAPTPDCHIELSTDVGAIHAGGISFPICEIELELKAGGTRDVLDLELNAGDVRAVLDFALQLLEVMPFRLEPASKAERGYALAVHGTAAPVKAVAPALAPGMSVTDAFRTVVVSCITHLQANDQGVLESDHVEHLHQARVAIRRLRSALSVFSSAFPRAAFGHLIPELRWLGGYLGPARDWDVFATETLSAVTSALPNVSGLAAIAQSTEQLRRKARAGARDGLGSKRYTAFLLQLVRTLVTQPWVSIEDEQAARARDMPLLNFAGTVLERRHKKVVKRGRGHAELSAIELHRLRIEIKKLRYAADFLSSLYDEKGVRDYTEALAGLQGLLGNLNDAATVERLSDGLREGLRDPAEIEALGLVRGWATGAARAHMAELPPAWKQFRECDTFWEQ